MTCAELLCLCFPRNHDSEEYEKCGKECREGEVGCADEFDVSVDSVSAVGEGVEALYYASDEHRDVEYD